MTMTVHLPGYSLCLYCLNRMRAATSWWSCGQVCTPNTSTGWISHWGTGSSGSMAKPTNQSIPKMNEIESYWIQWVLFLSLSFSLNIITTFTCWQHFLGANPPWVHNIPLIGYTIISLTISLLLDIKLFPVSPDHKQFCN